MNAKGGYCTAGNKEPCKIMTQLKRRIGVIHLEPTQRKNMYIFYDFEATQNTGTHTVSLSITQDFKGNEYVHNSIQNSVKAS